MVLARIASVGATFLLFVGLARAQNAGQSGSKPQHPKKLILTECEGGDNCGTWAFLWANGKGSGKWRTGEEAQLEMRAMPEGKVIILRSDVSGAREGLTATYEGTLSSSELGGTVKYIYNGTTLTGHWNAIIAEAAPIPQVMHFCASNCFTLKLDGEGKSFVAKNDAGVVFSTWTVESFTPESVILHRRDTSGFEVVYAGQIAKEGGSLVNQTANGNFDAAGIRWGSKLHTIPGSNSERDQLRGQPSPQIGIDGNRIVSDLATWGIEEFVKSLIRGDQQ